MKVLLVKDVYKLGRAGDVKRVADGYGRNYLLPQGLAVLATAGALKQAEHIRESANARRAVMNEEMSGIAELLSDLKLTFAAKAGETGKLYGSITSQMVADAVQEKLGVELNRRQIDHEPIRNLGSHTVNVRLTMDLIPEIKVFVHREGEAAVLAEEAEEEAGEEVAAVEEAATEAGVEAVAEAESAMEAEAEEEAAEPEEEAVEPEEETESEMAE
jgi:large subunit ribosomal protein L9